MKRIEDLILDLQKIKEEHGNVPIYCSSDAEGNSFSPLADLGIEYVDSDGEVWAEADVIQEISSGDYSVSDFKQVLIFWRV